LASDAGVAIPVGVFGALTHFVIGVEYSSQGAVKADISSPVGADWAHTFVAKSVKNLTGWADLDAVAAIPEITITTCDTGFIRSRI